MLRECHGRAGEATPHEMTTSSATDIDAMQFTSPVNGSDTASRRRRRLRQRVWARRSVRTTPSSTSRFRECGSYSSTSCDRCSGSFFSRGSHAWPRRQGIRGTLANYVGTEAGPVVVSLISAATGFPASALRTASVTSAPAPASRGGWSSEIRGLGEPDPAIVPTGSAVRAPSSRASPPPSSRPRRTAFSMTARGARYSRPQRVQGAPHASQCAAS